MKLVIHPPVDERRLKLVQDAAGDSVEVINAASPDDAAAAMPGAEAFFGKMTPALLARAGGLRWIQSPTASLEHYLFPALIDHPCQLTNMRGLYSDVIADHVMGYVLCFARNLHTYIRRQIQHLYQPEGGGHSGQQYILGPGAVSPIDRAHMHLADQTMGVVGLGAIGLEIRRRAEAFGIRVAAVDPINPDAWPMERLPELLSTSTFVVIAAPHTPRTERMFRTPLFEQMQPSSYLINIGRGAIVVLDDLVEALRSRTIAGAALDVYETEPLPADHPLWDFPNVILTPHIAGNSTRIAERHLALLLDNVRRFAAGDPLRNLVNKSEWF
ncbi:MAG: D-2-hydroxyacid dehydrogenase [Bryobacteraceae bacterium]